MDDKKSCTESCNTSHCKIIGGAFLVVATILTLITLNGLAVFGMFLSGLFFCGCKHMMSKRCCCTDKSLCCDVKSSSECSETKKDKKSSS